VDGWTAIKFKGQQMQTVEEQIASIKAHMPQVYDAIKAMAAEKGKATFGFVRRGLKGEPNCFYANERGHVMGSPFNQVEATVDIACCMVRFGVSHFVIWSHELVMADSQHPPVTGPSTAPPNTGNSNRVKTLEGGFQESPVSSPSGGSAGGLSGVAGPDSGGGA
jgi:hypothetical protein